jgi:hypothetical protein
MRHPAESQRIAAVLDRPVVIGGCGRSGTTLLLSILSCHPNLFAIDFELMAFCPDSGAQTPDYSLPFRLDWAWLYAIQHGVPAGASRWCEKTPRNVLVFDRILERYGDRARLIHIVRDGRAVVASRHPTNPSKYHVPPARWVEDVSAGARFADSPNVHTLRYEDLVTDYEPTVRKLCDFIGEGWSDDMLRYPEAARVKEHLAFRNGASVLSRASLDAWRAPEHQAVVAELLRLPGASQLLARWGYD